MHMKPCVSEFSLSNNFMCCACLLNNKMCSAATEVSVS